MDRATFLALWVLVAIFIYAIFARGLLKASEPFRKKALEHYGNIVRSGRADPQLIERLEARLDEVYSNWAAWQLTALLICAVFISLPLRKISRLVRGEAGKTYLDDILETIRKDVDRFDTYWIGATVANSPAATTIFALVGIIGIAFFGSLSLLTRILSSHPNIMHSHRHAH